MKHFYEDIEGFMTHRNIALLDEAVRTFPDNGTWVELGSWTGKSAAYCVVELLNANKLGKFYCVDTWEGGEEHIEHDLIVNNSLKDVFLQNVNPVKEHITPIQSISWDAAENFEDESVDFCYVDAGHTYECVTNDLTAWWPKIKSGRLFAGDDYTKGWPEVQKAVQDFFKIKKVKVNKLGRCWVVTKP